MRQKLLLQSRLLHTTILCGLALTSVDAYANPQGGNVVGGSATITQNADTLTVEQHSDRAIIDWNSFDIAESETTRFQQPSSGSVALNRIRDINPSNIQGRLTANGTVILVNPNGVMFGANSQVNVNSLVVTASDIDNDQFMQGGKIIFNKPGNTDAKIIAQGVITVADAGLVGLVAPHVDNQGVITAKLGRVQLASGDGFTLDLAGDGISEVTVTGDLAEQIIKNSGLIEADGGWIELTAAAARNAVDALIVNTGSLKANRVSQSGGVIRLYAAKGVVRNQGTIDVSGMAGGRVEIDATTVEMQGEVLAHGVTSGGLVTINFDTLYQDAAVSVIDVSALEGAGGEIYMEGADEASLYASGAYIANGATQGGQIDMLAGRHVLLLGGLVTSTGGQGGGMIRIGGAYQGAAGTRRSQYTQIDKNTLILADALDHGDGGTVIIWSDGTTDFEGTITATGGQYSGNGGLIETSGKKILNPNGHIDASAANGEGGTWLLDPGNITISSGATTAGGAPDYEPDQGESIVQASDIVAALDAGTNVTVTTGGDAYAGNGNITVSTAITSVGTGNLTLSAYGHITVSSNITLAGGDLTLRARNQDGAAGGVYVNANITTGGGNVTIGGGSGVISGGSGYAIGDNGYSTRYGVVVRQVNAGGGNIVINGQGGTYSSSNNYGVWISNGNTVSTTGTGTIDIYGGGGSGGSNNHGIYTENNTNIQNASGDGAITLDGSQGSGSSYSIRLGSTNVIGYTTDDYSGVITLDANSGNVYTAYSTFRTSDNSVDFNDMAYYSGAGTTITTSNANITLNASSYITMSNLTATGGEINITTGGNINVGALNADDFSLSNSSGDITVGNITTTNDTINFSNQYGSLQTGSILLGTGAGKTITLTATGDVRVTGNMTAYTITLNSDSDGSGGGNIDVDSITTGGGDITLTGGVGGAGYAEGGSSSSNKYGVYVSGTIDAAGGNITIRGLGGSYTSANYGVYLLNTVSTTGTGAINIAGIGGTAGYSNHGIYLENSVMNSSGSGAITLAGQKGTGSAYGVYVYGSSKVIGHSSSDYTGAIDIDADGSGLNMVNGTIKTTNNTIDLEDITAINASNTTITTTNNDITINTTGGYLYTGDITVTGGEISLTSADYIQTGNLNADDISLSNGAGRIQVGNITTAQDAVSITNAYDYITTGTILLGTGVGKTIALTAAGDVVTGNMTAYTVTLNSDSDASGGGRISVGSITTGGGDITLTGGVGGAGYAEGGSSSSNKYGVYVSSTLNAAGGNITIRGLGGSYTSANHGVLLNNTVSTTGSGNIDIRGIGGTVGYSNYGIYLESNRNIQNSSGDGSITLIGQAGANSGSYGVYFEGTNVLGYTTADYTGAITIEADTNGFYSPSATIKTTNNTLDLDSITRIQATGTSFSTTNNDITINTTGGYLYVDDITATGGEISLTSADYINAGNLTADNISLTNGASYIQVGNITTSQDTVSLTNAYGGVSTGTILLGTGVGKTIALTATADVVTGNMTAYTVTLNSDSDASGGGRISVGSITTGGGDITLTGGVDGEGYAEGGSSFSNRYGVYTNSTLNAAGGNITIRGQGGSYSSGDNYGVYLNSSANLITTGSGTINAAGIGGSAGSNNHGIYSNSADIYNSNGSGAITLTGTTPFNGYGLSLSQALIGYSNDNYTGLITLAADDLNLTTGTVRTTNNIVIKSAVENGTIGVGVTSEELDITSSVLGRLTWGDTLVIGDTTNTGAITIDYTTTWAGKVAFVSNENSDITLNNNITSSVAGDAVVIAAGKNFVNGDDYSITLTNVGTKRWIIYSNTPGDDEPGSLSADQTLYGNTYDTLAPSAIVDPTYTENENTWVYVLGGGTITFTALGQTITYGDTLNLTSILDTTYAFACSTGCAFGDVVSGGSVTLSSAVGATSAVNTYAGGISIAQGDLTLGGAYSGYTLNFVAGDAIVNQATLNINASSLSKIYGATLAFDGDEFTPVGLQNGETIGSVTLTSAGAASGANATTYDITPSAATGGTFTASNYNITYNTGTLTVDPVAITVAADNQSFTYGGVNLGSSAFSLTSGSMVDNDEIGSVTLSAVDINALGTSTSGNNNVGTWGITPSAAVFSTGNANNYNITYATSGRLTVSQKALTISAAGISRAYDGTTAATVNLSDDRISGDLFTSSYSGAVFADDGDVDTNKTVNVSGISISGADAGNYSYNNTASTTANITPYAVTITADALIRTYGSVTLAGTEFTTTALQNGESIGSVTLAVSGAHGMSSSGNYNVGGWTVTPSAATGGTFNASNYTISYNSNTLTINQAALTIASGVTADDKIYDASDVATLSFSSPELAGDVVGDAVSVNQGSAYTATFSNANAASGKAVTVTGLGLSGADAGNYTLAQPALTADIDVRDLTISAESKSMTYGDGVPAYSFASSGLQGGETIGSVSYSDNATNSTSGNKNAGSWTITASSAVGGTFNANNYNLIYETGTLTVSQKALYIAGLTAQNKVYNADTNATLTGTAAIQVGDAVVGDDVSLGGTAVGSFANKNVADGKAVALSGLTLAGDDMGNYAISGAAGGLTADITPATLSITGVTADDKTYNRTTEATLNTGSAGLSGVFDGDTVSIDSTGASGSFGDWNVGNSKAVTTSGFSLAGGDSGNYIFSQPTTTASISAATLTITGVTADNKVYDGTTGATLDTGSTGLSGVFGGDSITLGSGSASGSFVSANVANGIGVTASGFTVSGDTGNYILVQPTTTANITQRGLTITANSFSKTYGDLVSFDGDEFSSSGLQNGETIGTVSLASSGAAANANVNNYNITASTATGGTFNTANYAITYVNGMLTVDPKALTLAANSASREYGLANPTLTFDCGTLVGGDSCGTGAGGIFSAGPTLSTLANSSSNVADGPFAINISGGTLSNSNYTIGGYTNGLLTITPASLTVSANDASRTYGSANPSFSYGVTGLRNDDMAGDVLTGLGTTTAASAASNIGDYDITMAGTLTTSNYSLTLEDGTLTVNPATLTVTPDNQSRTYGAANPSFTGSISGFVLGETEDAIVASDPTYSTAATSTSDVGSYAITSSGGTLNTSNYVFAYGTGSLSINKANLTVTAADKSKTYTQVNPALTGGITGFVLDQDESVIDTMPTYGTSASQYSNVGSYAITGSGGVDNNYSFTYVDGLLTVNPAALIITASDKTKTYGQALTFDSSNDFTVAGLLASDTVDTVTLASSGTAAGTNAGNYDITASSANGTGIANYTVAYLPGTLTINKANLVVTPDAVTKVYGDNNPAFSGTIAGAYTPDNITATYGSSAGVQSGVGDYAISVSSLSDPLSRLTNYNITYNTDIMTITPAALIARADNKSKHQGQINPPLTLTLTGLKDWDDASAFTGYSMTSPATLLSGQGAYTISLSGGVSTNYTITRYNGTLTVDAPILPQTVMNAAANDNSNLPYSGFSSGAGHNITLQGYCIANDGGAGGKCQQLQVIGGNFAIPQ